LDSPYAGIMHCSSEDSSVSIGSSEYTGDWRWPPELMGLDLMGLCTIQVASQAHGGYLA